MSDEQKNDANVPDPSIADQNIERLLGKAYKSERPDPAFATDLRARMTATASKEANRRKRKARPLMQRRRVWAAAALVLLAVGLGLLVGNGAFAPDKEPNRVTEMLPPKMPAPMAVEEAGELAPYQRVARAPGQAPAPERAKVGDAIKTNGTERRRLVLPDESVLYVNQETTVTITADREVRVDRGEVYVEVTPRTGDPFIVHTPTRRVIALGTKFDVRTGPRGTEVLVTQGRVKVDPPKGGPAVVFAGQRLLPDRLWTPGAARLAVAPRASFALDWTQDLAAAARARLVPQSDHQGGQLMMVGPNGQQKPLTMRKYHVDVHIENGFARTTIDQTYFNHTHSRQEGTFIFPLPPDAALSRLAMYVNGKLMEGGMAERGHARTVYESIVRSMKDPALLEWVDGTTFKMRVFPLEPRQEKRIIISYTQKLQTLYGKTTYRFPGGHNMRHVASWSFHANVKDGAKLGWSSPSHKLTHQLDGADLALSASATNTRVDQDVVLELRSAWFADAAKDRAEYTATLHEKSRYFSLSFRPHLPGEAKQERRDWVFLFESSGSRSPLLARAQVELIHAILDNAGEGDSFNILTAGTRTQSFADAPQPVNAETIQKAISFLDSAHLVGALDLDRALTDAAIRLAKPDGVTGDWSPTLVHLGSALPRLGTRDQATLLARLPEGVPYVGIGVGKLWSRAFMKAAAAKSGGYFTQVNPDEDVRWRGYDLLATLNTPRLLDVRVTDVAEKATFLTYTDSIAQGEELTAITRIGKEDALPSRLMVSGRLDGKPFRQELAVENVKEQADHLPRIWAKMEIDRLLAADAAANKPKIIELSKAMYVMSPYTSLLVLENEQMYKQFKVDRGRKDHWALYPAPATIKVVTEPDARPAPNKAGEKRSPAEICNSVLIRIPPVVLGHVGSGVRRPNTVTAWDLLYSRSYNGVTPFPAIFIGSFPPSFEGSGLHFIAPDEYKDLRLRARIERATNVRLLRLNFSDARAWREISEGKGTIDGLRFLTLDSAAYRGGVQELILQLESGQGSISRLGQDKLVFGGALSSAPWDRLASAYRPWPPSRRLPDAMSFPDARAWREFSERRDRLSGRGNDNFRVGGRISFEREYAGFGYDPRLRPNLWSRERPVEDIRRAGFGKFSRGLEDYLITYANGTGLRGARSSFFPTHFSESYGDGWSLGTYRYAPDGDPNAWRLRRNRGAYSDMRSYRQPMFSRSQRIFSVLLQYAPGLNTSWADLQAVVEAEGKPGTTGTIDPAARKLIDQARGAGWRQVTLPDSDGQPLLTIGFDGTGRYRYDRLLPSGLKETVVCDGKQLGHLYAELGLGAKRTMGRVYRQQLTALVPWALPTAEDLAHRFDLKIVGERTIALVPRGAATWKNDKGEPLPYLQMQLVFGEDGRLVERRLVRAPEGKLLLRQTYGADGVIRQFDADGKEQWSVDLKQKAAVAPDLGFDEKKLVLLSLPLRTRSHLMKTRGYKGGYDQYSVEDSLALIVTDLHQYPETARQIIGQRFFARGDRRIGFYTLLAATGHSWDRTVEQTMNKGPKVMMDPMKDHPESMLAWYLADQLRMGTQGRWGAGMNLTTGPEDSFLARLTRFRAVIGDWADGGTKTEKETRRALGRAYKLVRETDNPFIVRAVFSLLASSQSGEKEFATNQGVASKRFEQYRGLHYAGRYEYARTLTRQGRWDEARREFATLYRKTVESGILPLTDKVFRQAFTKGAAARQQFGALMRETSPKWIEQFGRPMAIRRAFRLYGQEEKALADEMFQLATADVPEAEAFWTTLMAADYLAETGRETEAEERLAALLKEKKYAGLSTLWRRAAALADKKQRSLRALRYMERAIEIDCGHAPEGVDLRIVRREFDGLMTRYEKIAKAYKTLEKNPPSDFAERIARAADRWRALDPDYATAAMRAGWTLIAAGATEQAWDYMTMSPAQPEEASKRAQQWLSLANALKGSEKYGLADRAYAEAAHCAPANAQILWDRAQLLRRRRHFTEALPILKRLAEGKWGSQYRALQQKVRLILDQE